jgi:hypothetical protein
MKTIFKYILFFVIGVILTLTAPLIIRLLRLWGADLFFIACIALLMGLFSFGTMLYNIASAIVEAIYSERKTKKNKQ